MPLPDPAGSIYRDGIETDKTSRRTLILRINRRTGPSRTPAHRPFAGAFFDHVRGFFYDLPFLLKREISRYFMMITMTGDFMSVLHNCLYLLRVTLGDSATGKKSC